MASERFGEQKEDWVHIRICTLLFLVSSLLLAGNQNVLANNLSTSTSIGREVDIEKHHQDGEEFQIQVKRLIQDSQKLFAANWTIRERAERRSPGRVGTELIVLRSGRFSQKFQSFLVARKARVLSMFAINIS